MTSTQTRTGGPTGGADGPRTPWYRSRGALLGAGVAVVLAIAIVTDLPAHATHAQNVAGANAFIKEVNADLKPCAYALTEAFGFRRDQIRGTLTTQDRRELPGLFNDDEQACSLADPSIEDLTTGIESPGTSVSDQLGEMLGRATQWVTPDALRAIDALQELSTDPSNVKDQRDLARAVVRLGRDRDGSQGYVVQADTLLAASLYQVDLPAVPVLPAHAGPLVP